MSSNDNTDYSFWIILLFFLSIGSCSNIENIEERLKEQNQKIEELQNKIQKVNL